MYFDNRDENGSVRIEECVVEMSFPDCSSEEGMESELDVTFDLSPFTKLKSLVEFGEKNGFTSKVAKLIDKAYQTTFVSFEKKVKRNKNVVLNPKRKSNRSSDIPKLAISFIQSADQVKRNPRVKTANRRKVVSKKRKLEGSFEKKTVRTKTNKRCKSLPEIETKDQKETLAWLTESYQVPRNVKSYLDEQKRRTSVFPANKELQVIYSNALIDKLPNLFHW